jgi:hypothetical protein
MPYCQHCGTENSADSKFCKECGRPPFGNVPVRGQPKLAFWKRFSGRGRHPAVGTFGMVLSVIGLLLFCAKPSLGMTILSFGVVVLIYAAITGNLKLFR